MENLILLKDNQLNEAVDKKKLLKTEVDTSRHASRHIF